MTEEVKRGTVPGVTVNCGVTGKMTEGVITKKSESFISPPTTEGARAKEVVWIRHAALKEHDLMIPMEGLNVLNDLRIQAQKKVNQT